MRPAPPSARYPWTPADDAVIRRDYPREGAKPLALALGRSPDAVRARAARLGLIRETPTRRARALMAAGVPAREAAEVCGVREWDLVVRSSDRRRGTSPPWTADELATLREAFARGGLPAAREALPGRSDAAIWATARRHGLRSGIGRGGVRGAGHLFTEVGCG
jgi:hypothetical protein